MPKKEIGRQKQLTGIGRITNAESAISTMLYLEYLRNNTFTT